MDHGFKNERKMNKDELGSIATGANLSINAIKIIEEKNRIIRLQNKRIEQVESELEKVKKDRDSLRTKVTLLSYKLQLTNPKFVEER